MLTYKQSLEAFNRGRADAKAGRPYASNPYYCISEERAEQWKQGFLVQKTAEAQGHGDAPTITTTRQQ